ncbi:MAG: ABC transporter ATP-binding protein [Alphaproteobacteria bacterium]|nr:ABC transporter ATP-binding protein [Alphaproteobacteria bacterium]
MTGTVALQVQGLTRRYGTRVAVDDLHLTVHEGDVYGFLGPNGAGKTTAMRCILGLIRPDAGSISVFGEPDPVRARRHVGAIVETPAFHGWMSGRANLEQACAYAGIAGAEVQTEIGRVLDRVGLTERAIDRAGTYSLGMKQRLAIARALLGRPRLMLLDEPTNGLDPRGMREMRDLIRSLALHDRITIFISSHLLAEVAAICNRVGIIQEGRLRAEGRVDALIGEGNTAPIVEVGSAEPDALEAVVAAVEGAEPLGPGPNGRLLVRLDAITPEGLARALVQSGVPMTALVPTERNLEDVFLEVTR